MKFRMTPVAAALTAMFAVPAFAADEAPAAAPQEKAVQLPAVKTSGQQETPKAEQMSSPKFTQPLLNTPQTITIIKKEVLQQQAATSLTEALRNIPGITFTAGENGNTQSGDTVFMRGFDTQGSIFLDNVRDLNAAVRDVFNVEQVEVVKGPSGADNGRAATSGYINLSSKLPQADDFVAGTVSYGSAEKRRATADLNQQIGSSSAVRLNLMGQDGGVAGRDFIERESWGVAPSVGFGLGTSTRAYLFSQHVRQNNIPDGLVPTVGLDGYRFAEAVEDALEADNRIVAPVDSENFYGSVTDYEDIEANMYTAKVEHDLSSTATIRNLTRYGKSEQERLLTAPNGAPQVTTTAAAPFTLRDPADYDVNRGRHGSFRTNEILTNQTSVTTSFKTDTLEHNFVGGLEYIDESQDSPTKALANANAFRVNLYNPNRNAVVPGIVETGYNNGETETVGAYVIDTIKLDEQWQVNGSLRYDHYRTKTVTVTAANTPAPATVKLRDSGNLISWKAGILFKPAPNGSLYASAANSQRPPGGDNFTLSNTATNISNPAFDPQEATNMELGAKWDFMGGKLATTIAFFSTENKNDLAQDINGQVQQFGEKQVEGVELGAVGLITDNWTITAGLTRQNTRVTEGTASQTDSPINWSPRLMANFWTTYKIVPLKLTLGAGGRYQQDQVRQINNNPTTATGLFSVDSYAVFDAMASFEATKNVTLQVNAYNLFDKEYVATLNNSGQRYKPGEPLSYLATIVLRY